MTKVIKKGGKKPQEFSPIKIKTSIERAAKDAKLNHKKISELIIEVATPVIELAKKKRTVTASELRRSILGRLERRNKAVPKKWREFEKKKK